MGERNKDNNKDDSTISRRESITKLDKYAALTALGTFINTESNQSTICITT